MVTVTLNSTSCSTDTLAQPIPSDVLHGELYIKMCVLVCEYGVYMVCMASLSSGMYV